MNGNDIMKLNSILNEVADERVRQVEKEGWTLEHDDRHELGELAAAAGCYAIAAAGNPSHPEPPNLDAPGVEWPWLSKWWKPSTARRNLVKAAALIVAEIERLDRVTDQQESK